MKSIRLRLCLVMSMVVALVVLVTLAPLASSPHVYAGQGVVPLDPVSDAAAANGASLHNPGFDNHDWYEFNYRYQRYYPTGSWLPDDDNNQNNDIPEGSLQDWRLWFQDGTAIVESDPESVYAHSGEGVQVRPYDWGSGNNQLAGLYQVIYDTTPGLVYYFQMYGQSRPENTGKLAVLQIGIDQVGWHPESKTDPAVHNFPATTVWGDSHNDYTDYYGPLNVMAEALGDKITVFTYADAPGGRHHRILWDTGSFLAVTQEVWPKLIPDPDNPPAASGISSPAVDTTSTSATVSWNTPGDALGQVYYRLVSSPSTPVTPTGTLLYTAYLPMISHTSSWTWTSLNKSPMSSHSEVISGLRPNSTYEYIVASRGVSGGVPVTWVSYKREFTTDAAQ